uniref:Uncharacterized protein n=1 Tax=uncultured marine crenarchaeote HF4000_APKG3E18 TaxID=455585 RepID=B3T7I8_9ARCH|nr:hypothetical protein ALOHA_HF4000APKG3E18ctg5g12 [uncultured marine crenarchaeote HF4000_APKG3E18]
MSSATRYYLTFFSVSMLRIQEIGSQVTFMLVFKNLFSWVECIHTIMGNRTLQGQ